MPLPRSQQANLPDCSPHPPINAKCQVGKLWIPFFKVFWYDSTKGMNPSFTDCEADALTTTLSRRFCQKRKEQSRLSRAPDRKEGIQCQRSKESSTRGKRKRRVFLCRRTVRVKEKSKVISTRFLKIEGRETFIEVKNRRKRDGL